MQGDHPQGDAGRRDRPPPAGRDDGPAFRGLLDRWFDACVDVAWHVLDDVDAAVEVATETFATAWEREMARRPPAEAGIWLLGTARERALGRRTRGGGPAAPGLRLGGPATDDEGADLARAVLAALGPADASVLSLHLRHDLDVAAVAEVLATSPNDARERLLGLRRRLGGAVRAWAMWPRGRPGESRCSVLRRELEAAGVTEFGPDAVRVLGRHAGACPLCRGARRAAGSSPEATFAAVPSLPAGTAVAAGAVAALAARGIPVGAPGPAPTRAPLLALPPGDPAPAARAGPTGAADPAAPARRAAGPAHATRRPGTPGGAAPSPPRRPTRGRGLVAVGLTALVVAGLSLIAARDGSDGLHEARTAAGRVVAATSTTTAPPATTPTTAAVGPLASTPSTSTPPPPPDPGTTTTAMAPPLTGVPTTTAAVPAPQPGAEPPVITDFAVAEQSLGSPCQADQRRIILVWEAVNADQVTLGGEGAPSGALAPSGSTVVCRDQGPPVTYTLYASGPGGMDTRTAAA